jgi:hypothetical protein
MKASESHTCRCAGLPVQAPELPTGFHKLIGLLFAVSIPTTFWVFLLKLGSGVVGIAVGPPTLGLFGLGVAMLCLLGVAIVWAGSEEI